MNAPAELRQSRSPAARFSGAVLAGGRSRRMGEDKAFIDVGGRPLVLVAATALDGAGADEVFAVGGDAGRLGELGIRTVPDPISEGPLPAIAVALAAAATEVVVVLACDLPAVTPAAVAAVVDGLAAGGDAAVAVTGDRVHPLLAAYRVACLPPLQRSVERGTRRVVDALSELDVRRVPLAEPGWATNLNDPTDYARWTRQRASEVDTHEY